MTARDEAREAVFLRYFQLYEDSRTLRAAISSQMSNVRLHQEIIEKKIRDHMHAP